MSLEECCPENVAGLMASKWHRNRNGIEKERILFMKIGVEKKESSTATMERWNAHAQMLQGVFDGGMNDYNARFMDFVFSTGMIKKGGSMADIGCGVGKYGTFFAKLGCEVTLLDISPVMLEKAEKNMSKFETPWRTILCNLDEATFEDLEKMGKFDLVMSTMSPAIYDELSLAKMSSMSSGWCIAAKFVDWKQPNKDALLKSAGLPEDVKYQVGKATFDHLYWKLRNIGYRPHTKLVEYNFRDLRTPQQMADSYLVQNKATYSGKDPVEDPKDVSSRIISVASSMANEEGLFDDAVYATAGWLYWNVNER